VKKKYASWKAKSVSGAAIYYMGIVDFLQEWNLRKRVERAAKIYIQRNDPQGVSVMRPSPYRDRFQRKMEQIFDLDDPFGLFNDRGSASVRKNYFLATSDGRPILSNPSYVEIPRENNSDSKEGDGTVMNALHSSSSQSQQQSTSAASELRPSFHQNHHFPVSSYIPQVTSPFSSSSSSTIQHLSSSSAHSSSAPHHPPPAGWESYGESQEIDGRVVEEEEEEDEFGLKVLSHEKLTTVDIDH
jgi:hypothetical protein